ncbi:Formamidopyrimidine-DNA glycosylase [Planctomycetales bacterium 10988]|nr:Formamidopyrimidine-DNA glycosylase [Planctomycetales bacterium 10988]
MPELPEVETMCRGIAPVVGGKIQQLTLCDLPLKPIRLVPDLAKLKQRIEGKTIEGISRKGKRVVLSLSSDNLLVIEPRMTGLLLVSDPPNESHLRLKFKLKNAGAKELLYWDRRGLGGVTLFTSEEFQQHFDRTLGPDALTVSLKELTQRFQKSSREIKVALLDQKAIAGIGNLYAAEILHLSKIHPRRVCQTITKAEWKCLYQAMQGILTEAILYEGSTLSDGTYRNALNKNGSYQNHHRVYAKAGEICPLCKKAEIERIVQAQRSTFFCGKCQK